MWATDVAICLYIPTQLVFLTPIFSLLCLLLWFRDELVSFLRLISLLLCLILSSSWFFCDILQIFIECPLSLGIDARGLMILWRKTVFVVLEFESKHWFSFDVGSS